MQKDRLRGELVLFCCTGAKLFLSLPVGSVELIPVFLGRHAAFLPEEFDEVALGGKGQIGRNLHQGKVREA